MSCSPVLGEIEVQIAGYAGSCSLIVVLARQLTVSISRAKQGTTSICPNKECCLSTQLTCFKLIYLLTGVVDFAFQSNSSCSLRVKSMVNSPTTITNDTFFEDFFI